MAVQCNHDRKFVVPGPADGREMCLQCALEASHVWYGRLFGKYLRLSLAADALVRWYAKDEPGELHDLIGNLDAALKYKEKPSGTQP